MKKLISGILAAMLFTMSVSAVELNAKYDAATKKYNVYGSMPEAVYNGFVSIKVISDSVAAEEMTDETQRGWIGTLRVDENGKFSESFVFAPNAKSGYYTVSAGIYELGVVETTSLLYVSEQQKASALEDVNDAIAQIKNANADAELKAAYTALDNAITDNALYLGIDTEMYNSIGEAKDTLFEILSERTYTDVDEFIVELEKNMAYALIENADETTITIVMDEYFSKFALESSELYDEFLTLDKNDVYEKIAGMELRSEAEVKDAFDVAVALTLINNSSNWNEFKTVLELYIEYTGISTTYYEKCDKSALATAICDNEYSEAQKLYDDIKAYYDENNSNSTSSGKGGGGGSGRAPGLTVSGSGQSQNNVTNIGDREETEKKPLYSDMSGFEWAEAAVSALTERGIVNGDGMGKFNPADFVTREEFVKILLLATDLYEDGSESDFADVDENIWAYPYISRAYDLAIVNGINGGLFGYGMKITRQDMAVLIERASTIAGIELEKKNEVMIKDADALADYAKESVLNMVEAGIIKGYDDATFRPANEATRAEAAVMIYRLLSR